MTSRIVEAVDEAFCYFRLVVPLESMEYDTRIAFGAPTHGLIARMVRGLLPTVPGELVTNR